MKLTKEQVYINLQGKTKEELTDLWEFLTSNGEKVWSDLDDFLTYEDEFFVFNKDWYGSYSIESKTETTIDQLKQIIKPMGTFTPIAMKCNQEQFDAIKPKLKNIGKIGNLFLAFKNDNIYLVNNYNGEKLFFDISVCYDYNRKVHEEWNEEIFLKSCGIEGDSLEQQLQKAEAEVKRLQSLIEEENKPKVGDWIINTQTVTIFKNNTVDLGINDKWNKYKKITNQELIKLLEQEIK